MESWLREAFFTHLSASESAEEKKRVIIEAEERYTHSTGQDGVQAIDNSTV